MKTISIINLKGGVAKTITADNTAHILATIHKKKVLLVDDDPQGNTTSYFGLAKNDIETISDVLLIKEYDINKAIYSTRYEYLQVIGANMDLFHTNLKITEATILKDALRQIETRYDYCIIDNAPNISVSMINGLAVADEIIIPVTIDDFSFEGMADIAEQIEIAKQFNPSLVFKGCLVTQYTNNAINIQGKEKLKEYGYPVFDTNIRRTDKVKESTFARMPIVEYSPRCGAARDYKKFVKEYLGE